MHPALTNRCRKCGAVKEETRPKSHLCRRCDHPRRKQSLLAKSITSLSYRKMADIVSLLRQEVKSRNPLFVNAYVPYLDSAEAVLRELHNCERRRGGD